MKVRNITELQNSIRDSESVKAEFLNNPEEFIYKIEENKPIQNKYIFLTVIGIVGLALLSSLGIAGILAMADPELAKDVNGNPVLLQKDVDNFFVMIGSAAIGALAGLLAPTPNE